MPAGGGAPPLSDRVLLDWSGTWGLHVKGVVVRAAGSTMGFVGGIDFGWNRLDKPDHPQRPPVANNPHPAGWHDIAVRVRGPAVSAVWADFVTRWTEVASLSPRNLHRGNVIEPFNCPSEQAISFASADSGGQRSAECRGG